MAKCIMCEIHKRTSELENGVKNIKIRFDNSNVTVVKNVPFMYCDKCCEEFISKGTDEKLKAIKSTGKRVTVDFNTL